MSKHPNKIIDVVILPDTAAFIKGKTRVFMVSDHSPDTREGTANLKIKARVGDYIRWRIEPIQNDEIVDILEIIPGVDGPNAHCINKPTLTPDGWTSRVLAVGEESYKVVFSINSEGIYSWDPIIDVRPD